MCNEGIFLFRQTIEIALVLFWCVQGCARFGESSRFGRKELDSCSLLPVLVCTIFLQGTVQKLKI